MTEPRSRLVLDRRRFLAASLGGLGTLALGSCSSGSRTAQGGRPTVRLSQGALGFPSPFAANADLGYNQMSLVYDSLLWRDSTGQLLPWLASSFETSADRLTYTFKLRDGLRWSDGRPLTADDVQFTFEYYEKQETLSPPVLVQPPQGIDKVTAVDATTVTITLQSPLVTFLGQVAAAVPIIPRHVWSGIDDPAAEQDPKILIGSGAYRLAKYDGDGGPMLFTARDDYFLGVPHVGRIEYRNVEDPFAGLLSDATDAALGDGLRPDILAPFQNADTFGRISEQGSSTSAFYWNLGREGALADVRFRRACTMAIDRKDLVARLAAGRGLPGNPGFLGPDNPFFTPVPQHEFDVAGAGSLLDGAGYTVGSGDIRRGSDGRPLSFEMLIENLQAPLAELLVSSLRRIGVELRPKQVQMGPQLFGNKFIGAYDTAVLPFPGPGPGGPNGDPDVLRLLFSSEVSPALQAATAYANPAFNDLAEKQQEAFDEAERKSLVAQMQKILADDLPVLPLYYPERTIIFRKKVLSDWYFTPGQFPSSIDNKQLFITGQRTGAAIRSVP